MNASNRKRPSLLDTISSNRWYVLLASLLCFIPLAAVVSVMPSKFDAEAMASFNLLSPEILTSTVDDGSEHSEFVSTNDRADSIDPTQDEPSETEPQSDMSASPELRNDAVAHQQMLSRAATAREILASRELAIQVVRALGAERILQPQSYVEELFYGSKQVESELSSDQSDQNLTLGPLEEQACNALLKMTDIQSDDSAYLVRFRVRSGDADLSHAILKTYVEQYQATDLIQTNYVEQLSQLESQYKQHELKVTESRNAIAAFLDGFANADLEEERRSLQNKILEAESELDDIEVGVALEDDLINRLTTSLASLPKLLPTESVGIEPEPAKPTLQTKLVELRNQEEELSDIYLDDHPSLKSLRDEILATRKLIQSQDQEPETVAPETQKTGNPKVAELMQKIEDAEERKTRLKTRRKLVADRRMQFGESITALRKSSIQLAELNSSLRVAESESQQAKIALNRAERIANYVKDGFGATEWTTPTIQRQSSSPNRILWLACAAVGSVFVGLFVGTLKRNSDKGEANLLPDPNPSIPAPHLGLEATTNEEDLETNDDSNAISNAAPQQPTEPPAVDTTDDDVTWVAKSR